MKIFSKLILILLCVCLAVCVFASCDVSEQDPGENGSSEGSGNSTTGGQENQAGGNSGGGSESGESGSGNSGSGNSGGEPGNVGGNDLPDIPVLQYFDVTFVYNNGEKDYVRTYKSNDVYPPVVAPKLDGYTFVGWCKDAECEKFFDFDTVLTEDITLYAKWSLDYAALNYKVSQEAVKFNVKVTTDFQLTEFNRKDTMQGSGVLYYCETINGMNTYYVITNNHVVDYTLQYSSREFKVYDYRGNKYSAKLVVADPNYDLAVLRFQTSASITLSTAKIRLGVPAHESLVIGLGAPLGQFNTISYGTVKAFQLINIVIAPDPRSNVKFEVIYHDAYSNNGSSGGPVVDINFDIIAINYASGRDDQGNFTQGFAVGSDKVVEFLAANGLSYVLSDGTVVTPTESSNNAS